MEGFRNLEWTWSNPRKRPGPLGPREDLGGFGIYRFAICLGPTSRSLQDRVSLPQPMPQQQPRD